MKTALPKRDGGRIRNMAGTSGWTYLFYGFVALLVFVPTPLIWQYWREARSLGWDWSSRDSRDMYVDGAKTLITASGIALAVVASSAERSTGSATNSTDTQPLSIAIDPALGRYVYTANYLGNSVSGFRLDPNAGNLSPTQATPYPSDQNPTAIAIVPHGNHSLQAVTP